MGQTSEDSFQWIDILRGIASLGIVLYHSRVPLWVGFEAIRAHPESFSSFDRIVSWLSLPIPFLGSGVMLFFVLSGFCIHYPTVKRNNIEFVPYIKRRLIRIWPPYFFAIVVTFLCEWWMAKFYNVPISTLGQYIKSILMIQNYPPYPAQLNSNPSLWSLPVEVELYFLYPLIYALYKAKGITTVSLVVIGVSLLGLILTMTRFPWMQEDVSKYLVIWFLGAFLAEKYRTNSLPVWKKSYWLVFILVCGLSFLMLMTKVSYAYIHYVWGIAFILLLWGILQLRSPKEYFSPFVLKILLYLGKISYSLYLIHFTLFQLMGKAYQYYFHAKSGNLMICFAAILLVVAIAGLFFKFIEEPFHRLAKKFGKPNMAK